MHKWKHKWKNNKIFDSYRETKSTLNQNRRSQKQRRNSIWKGDVGEIFKTTKKASWKLNILLLIHFFPGYFVFVHILQIYKFCMPIVQGCSRLRLDNIILSIFFFLFFFFQFKRGLALKGFVWLHYSHTRYLGIVSMK